MITFAKIDTLPSFYAPQNEETHCRVDTDLIRAALFFNRPAGGEAQTMDPIVARNPDSDLLQFAGGDAKITSGGNCQGGIKETSAEQA
jgi:hypothetical protein